MNDYIGLHERYSKNREDRINIDNKYFKYGGLFIILALLSALIFYSGIWRNEKKVNSIELTGNTSLSKDEIFSFARLNDSLIKTGSLSLQIIEERISKHPDIQSVNVSNESGNFIIEIAEKNPFAVIIRDNRQPLMADDKLNLYHYRRENKPIDVPVISGLSGDIDINNVSREDYNMLKIAQYLIGRSNSINKMMYKYISEISFRDTNCLVLFGGDKGTAIYLLDYDMLIDIKNFSGKSIQRNYTSYQTMNRHQLINIKNELFVTVLNEKLMMFNDFLKKILPYRGSDAFKYVDLRYKGSIIIKSN